MQGTRQSLVDKCAFPEKMHQHTMEGHQKFLGGGGVLKVKILGAKYEAKLELPWEEGAAKPSMGRVWIFSGTAQIKLVRIVFS